MSFERSSGSDPVIISSSWHDSATVSGLDGSYRVLRLLGRGTMASVYLAEQVSMARPVALKILSPILAGDPSFVERFLREARASARLNHPNIVSAIDFGECDSRFFLAMEFVDGTTLSSMLLRDGVMAESRVLSIGLQVISALDHAARHNVIHLDVKPANIMIAKDGLVKLTDFGLAMILDNPGIAEASRRAAGTPYYMAPEQVGGGNLDWRADQFSLGASLYEVVTGQKPFQGNSVSDIMYKRLFDKPLPAWKASHRKASRAFSAVLAKMLSRSPDDRYQSFSDLERDFNRVKNGKKPAIAKLGSSSSFSAPSASAWGSFGNSSAFARMGGMSWRRRWNWIIYSTLFLLVLLCAYAAMYVGEIVGPVPPRQVRHDLAAEAERLSAARYPELRERWVGAARLVARADADPDPESLLRAIYSMKLIAGNRNYAGTAYANAAERCVTYLEEKLRLFSPPDADVGGAISGYDLKAVE